eukprot:TRINITY_DN6020_c0_g1_i2.p1 TRINITY_DN6020_c0_g1~~TRINITY_DN6020_c0_g1_i2.p1  ORF type:complete len:843 (-),score=180.23 TRINITY_DN6020_c0_g1_i2:58-2586(-)
MIGVRNDNYSEELHHRVEGLTDFKMEVFDRSAVNVLLTSIGEQWTGTSFYKSFYDYCPLPMGVCQALQDDILNLECNAAAAGFFNRMPSDVRGRTSISMGAPKDCVRNWVTCYYRSITEGHPCSIEYVSECATEADIKWFRCTIFPIAAVSNSSFDQRIFAYIIHDITETKVLELKTAKMKAELETLVNSVECVVWEVNAMTGCFTFVSEQSEQILGYGASEWTNFYSFMQHIIYEEDRGILACLSQPTTQKRTITFRAIRKSGEIIWIRSIINKSAWNTYYGVMMDVSEEKKVKELEEEKKEMSTRLRDKSEFVAGISHEIRTPLNGIIGMISLVLDDSEITKQAKDYLEASLNCADSLLGVVNDVLDFAKIEAGKMTVEMIPFNLRKVVEDTANLMIVKSEEKDVDIIVNYPSTVDDSYIGDSTRIRQVITNLVVNAIKFTSKGFVTITAEKTPNGIKIVVTDTGIGISEDQVIKLFNMFHQADVSICRVYGGTGIGLAISRHLVTLMGGEIGVESKLGEGSSFWFQLPLEVQEPVVPRSLSISAVNAVTTLNVLLVLSNRTLCDVVSRQLVAWNPQIRPAACLSAGEALELIEISSTKTDKNPFDLVIFETEMSDRDRPMVEVLCAMPRLASVPLIALSKLSHRDKWSTYNTSNHQHISMMTKPLLNKKLSEAISNAFRDVFFSRSFENERKKIRKLTHAPSLDLSYTPRILVVDDNIINQKIATKMLEKFSMVDTADTGSGAVAKVVASFKDCKPYDLIFMDICMPGNMNGYEATLAIREWEKKSGICSPVTIIALTASVTDHQTCLNSQMQGYIPKPFRMQDFQQICQRYLHALRNL